MTSNEETESLLRIVAMIAAIYLIVKIGMILV